MILEGAEVRIYRILRPRGEGSSEGTLPRVPKAPRDGPKVDPNLRGQENPISPRTEKSIGITFSEERSGDPYEQAPLGMLVTYTDPYEQAGLGMIGLYVKQWRLLEFVQPMPWALKSAWAGNDLQGKERSMHHKPRFIQVRCSINISR